jgi:hypothetical protein
LAPAPADSFCHAAAAPPGETAHHLAHQLIEHAQPAARVCAVARGHHKLLHEIASTWSQGLVNLLAAEEQGQLGGLGHLGPDSRR